MHLARVDGEVDPTEDLTIAGGGVKVLYLEHFLGIQSVCVLLPSELVSWRVRS
jgi:hypothetical protein